MIILPSLNIGNLHFSSSINTNNLVYHVESRNPNCYPGAGTTVNDLRGINTNGILSGVTFINSDKSFQMDDFDSYITFDRGFTSPTNNFTVIVCTYLPIISLGEFISIFSSDNSSAGGIFLYYTSSPSNDVGLYAANTIGDQFTEIIAEDVGILNKKFILAFSLNGINSNLYINGLLKSSSSSAPNNIDFEQKINLGFAPEAFIGTKANLKIYEALIYSRVLSDSEILQNSNILKLKYNV